MITFKDNAKLLPITSGIYIIKNIKTNKIYIGSANNFKLRFIKHRRLLRANCHHSQHLQNAYNKDTEDAFIFDILEETSDLTIREQYYLDLYKSYDRTIGYNISPTAYNNTGIVRTEEYKKNKAEVHAKDWYIVTSPDGVITRTKVLRYFEIYNEKGNKIPEEQVKDRLRILALGKTSSNTYYGWKCVFEEDSKREKALITLMHKLQKNKKEQDKAIVKLTQRKLKTWEFTFPDGHIEIVLGLKEFCKVHNLTNVSRAASTGQLCNGFKVRKLN